ncbi:MAG: hypothetical protein QW102_00415 [Candidatus Nezhaarchaeales archaeon]
MAFALPDSMWFDYFNLWTIKLFRDVSKLADIKLLRISRSCFEGYVRESVFSKPEIVINRVLLNCDVLARVLT